MTRTDNNFKLINKSEIARLYKKEYGKSISPQYIGQLLNAAYKGKKSPERLREIRSIIADVLDIK